jgi:hypothetical protein
MVRLPRTKRSGDASPAPFVFSLETGHGGADALAAPGGESRATAPGTADRGPETVGDRMRVLYERAVRHAVECEGRGRARRADRGRLLQRIADERLLIPSEEHRVSLRMIAREMDSSIARVVQCEHRLRERVREWLAGDPEVVRLREVARSDPAGMNVPMDGALVQELRDLVEQRFLATFFRAKPEEQTELLTRLMECCGRRVGDVVRGLYASLPQDEQDAFLTQTRAMAG